MADQPTQDISSSPPPHFPALLERHAYLSLEPKGLFVNVPRLESGQVFHDFVDQVFRGGGYFPGLSYKNLAALLYRLASVKANFPRLRLADGIAVLPQGRLALYQGELLANPQQAEYDFTLQVDSRANFAQGVKPLAASEGPRSLDEFVAVLWTKGVKFGLDLEAIQQGLAIAKNQLLRLVVAQAQMPQPGADARLEPLISLEKDLRPIESPQGEVDLRRYACIFPQAKANQVILRKLPASLGQEGRTIFGEAIPTTLLGKDVSLEGLAGPGTGLAQVGKFQCLVALQAGFVSAHPLTGVISVTDEVINYTPVGIDTGSLTIEGERCVQFGGVGAGYSLEGRSLVLESGTVEGGVISRQGGVKVAEDVVGGQVSAWEGDLTVEGEVRSGAYLEAYNGRVSARRVENSLVVARQVVAQSAQNATIIAEQVILQECVDTGIFAFSAAIERIAARPEQDGDPALQSNGTVLVVPIIEPPRRQVVIINRTMELLLAPLPALEAQIEEIGSDPEIQKYLRALTSYQTAKTEEQAAKAQAVFTPLEDKVRPTIERWRDMKAERQRLQAEKAKLEQEREVWLALIRGLEEDLAGSMHYAVNAVSDPYAALKLFQDPRVPDSFAQAAALGTEQRRHLVSLCQQIISKLSIGEGKDLLLPLNGPLKASYRDMMALLEKQEDRPAQPTAPVCAGSGQGRDRRREKRLELLEPRGLWAYLADPERRTPEGRFVLPVRVDELLDGYVHDLTGLGMGIMLEREQKYAPVFQKHDKIALEFFLGPISFEARLVVVEIEETPRLVRVGGYFVNIPPNLQANLYKIKNALESRLWGGMAAANAEGSPVPPAQAS